MGWAKKSNPALVEAIVASFCSSPENARRSLSKFKSRDWARTELWLDNSGLALYFLSGIRAAGIADAVESGTLRRLEQKLAENRGRKADMMREFVAINRAFRDLGLRYANLKGVTLAPESCPDLSLRRQSDLDFLIDPADTAGARGMLERRGYEMVFATERTVELKSGHSQKVSLEGHYRVTPVRSVELHTALEPDSPASGEPSPDQRLDRLTQWRAEEGSFPALSSADQLIGQALHLLGHLLSEHTRPSWLLEYRRHVLARRADAGFWTDVQRLASGQRYASMALGLSTLLARDLFGEFDAPELDSWTLNALPSGVRLWAERYGRRAVLADVPGTKLYLFLDGVLSASQRSRERKETAKRLFPMHGPPKILRPPPKDTIRLWVQREIAQFHYFFYRARFHAAQGAVYLMERRRWWRILKREAPSVDMHPMDPKPRTLRLRDAARR